MKLNKSGYVAGLDVGERRIGVALTHTNAALPAPYDTFVNDEAIWQNLRDFINKEEVIALVVGLPRGMNGQDTAQTAYTADFVEKLRQSTDIPIFTIDEAVTSIEAKKELNLSGKRYNKGMVDALAAAIILQDFLNTRDV